MSLLKRMDEEQRFMRGVPDESLVDECVSLSAFLATREQYFSSALVCELARRFQDVLNARAGE